jgi:hypothetical protein
MIKNYFALVQTGVDAGELPGWVAPELFEMAPNLRFDLLWKDKRLHIRALSSEQEDSGPYHLLHEACVEIGGQRFRPEGPVPLTERGLIRHNLVRIEPMQQPVGAIFFMENTGRYGSSGPSSFLTDAERHTLIRQDDADDQ